MGWLDLIIANLIIFVGNLLPPNVSPQVLAVMVRVGQPYHVVLVVHDKKLVDRVIDATHKQDRMIELLWRKLETMEKDEGVYQQEERKKQFLKDIEMHKFLFGRIKRVR